MEISLTKQKLRSLQGRVSATQSILITQYKAHKNAVETLQQRLHEERELIANEIIDKQVRVPLE